MVAKADTFGDRLKWARNELRLKVVEGIVPALAKEGLKVSANRWYEWEKIGTNKDPRCRKLELKLQLTQENSEKPRRQPSYKPPWPDELAAIERLFTIRVEWLVSGKGKPFASETMNQRATDRDPMFGRLYSFYENLTEEQKHAIEISLQAFVGTNKRDAD
mgnify:FL=1